MYSSVETVFKYIYYWLSASNGKGHGTHSPFVFDLITKVLNDRTRYPEYKIVEELRKRMIADKRVLQYEDPGAGSSMTIGTERKVSTIAQHAAKPPKLGQLLFRMVRHYQPKVILELGTSLGITTSYLKLGNPRSELFSIEGAAPVADIARQNLENLSAGHFKIINANFDEELGSLLQKTDDPDLVFIDGNHRQEPTVKYFRQLLPYVKDETMLIFDDIHWSREMERAWANIKEDPRVTCTIDLYFLGIVLFRPQFREKQDFKIRF